MRNVCTVLAHATMCTIGDVSSPFGSVHSRYKQAVGARLAANALAEVYGIDTPHFSPRFLSATGSSSGTTVTVTVSFVPETVVDGLELVSGVVCTAGVPVSDDMVVIGRAYLILHSLYSTLV